MTGTIATDTSTQEVEAGARALLVKAKRLFRWNRRGTAAGEEGGEETVAGFTRGMAVVVQHTRPGENLTPEQIDRLADEGLTRMEGVVLSVDRANRTIAIRLTDGSRQMFRLSDQTAADGKGLDRADDGTSVVVFVKDEAGERVVHYFKRVP